MDTFLREGCQDQGMGLAMRREGPLHILRLSQGQCLMLASPTPPPPTLSQLLAQMPALPAPPTSCGEEGNEGVGNGGSLCLGSLA